MKAGRCTGERANRGYYERVLQESSEAIGRGKMLLDLRDERLRGARNDVRPSKVGIGRDTQCLLREVRQDTSLIA